MRSIFRGRIFSFKRAPKGLDDFDAYTYFEDGVLLSGLRTKYDEKGRVKQTFRWNKAIRLWISEIYSADGKLESEYGCSAFVDDLPYEKGYEYKYDEKLFIVQIIDNITGILS